MPDPAVQAVVPLGEHLLQPLHDHRKFQPVRRFNVKRQPVVRKTESANLENEPQFSFPEHPGKQRQGFKMTEQRFPVVDAGTDFIPYPLFQYA
jgi:hypothetical protein